MEENSFSNIESPTTLVAFLYENVPTQPLELCYHWMKIRLSMLVAGIEENNTDSE
jgi:hypothetical protein